MADPLSVAASIIAVLQLAQVVIQGVQAAKDGSKERKTVRDEVIYLSGLLFNLKSGLERRELNQELVSSLDAPSGPLSQLKDALEQLSKLLLPSTGLRDIGKTISWVLQKQKVDELLRRIERQKTCILFVLENNHLGVSHSIRQDVQDLKLGIDDIQSAVSQLDIHFQDRLEVDRFKEAEETLNWLSCLEFSQKCSDIQATMEADACQWFLSSPDFVGWRSGQGEALWCTGPPGVGKSCVASAVIMHLQQTVDVDEALAYLYCDYKDPMTQSIDCLLASILRQLSQRHAFVLEPVSNAYKHYLKRRTRPNTSQWLELIRQELQLCAKVYVIVDGLDEYGSTDDDRSALITRLVDLMPKIQLMVTSRLPPSSDMPIPKVQFISISGSDEDIKSYLVSQVSRMSRLARILKGDVVLTDRLLREILLSAKGMFLLAKLQLDFLAQSHSRRALIQSLDSLPLGLEELYAQTMSRIMDQGDADAKLAMSILALVAHVYRPLSLTELQHALELHANASRPIVIYPLEVFDDKDAVERDIIVSVCLGLISIQQGSDTVRLVHLTLQSYLDSSLDQQLPDSRAEVARICLACIRSSDLASGPCGNDEDMTKRLTQRPFLQYAGRYWGRHVYESGTSIDIQMILGIITPEALRESIVQIMHLPSREIEAFRITDEFGGWKNTGQSLPRDRRRRYSSPERDAERQAGYSQLYPSNVTALHIASGFGFIETVRSLVQSGASIHLADSYGWSALHRASENGHVEIVRLLLDLSADTYGSAQHGGTALHRAAKKGHKEVAQLLASITPIDSPDQTDATPLHRAARHGHGEIVKLLLDLGADINSCQKHLEGVEARSSYGPSLRYSNSFDQDAIVRVQKISGGTPLHEAAANGHVMVVKMLVEAKAPLATEDTFGGHALHRAAAEGQSAVVDVLIRAGADLNHNASISISGNSRDELNKNLVYYMLDNYCGTPLHLAARQGHHVVLEDLIAAGAALEILDSQNQTPLSAAASAGQVSVVELLLRKGCCIDGSAASDTILGDAESKRWDSIHDTYHKFNGYNRSRNRALRLAGWQQQTEPLMLEGLPHPKAAHVKIQETEGLTPLHDAAWYGHLEVVKLLVEHGASLDQQDARGRTPLQLATTTAADGVVLFLLQHGADASLKDAKGDSALKIACRQGELELIDRFQDAGVDIAAQEISSNLLLEAAKMKNWAVMQLLSEYGAEPNLSEQVLGNELSPSHHYWESETEKRWPLLWYTCQPAGEFFFDEYFAQTPPQSIKLADMNALLHRAVSTGCPWLLELLLDHTGDINNCNLKGESLLMCAISHHDLVSCKVLVSRNIDLNICALNARTSKPGCALTQACQNLDADQYVPLLLHAGANANNCQPLNHIDYSQGQWQSETKHLAEMLLEHGADPSAPDSEGKNAIMHAAYSGNLEAIELMLDRGGDPELRNNSGETAVSRAIAGTIRRNFFRVHPDEGHEKVILLLLEKTSTYKDFDDRHDFLKVAYEAALASEIEKMDDRKPKHFPITPERLRHWASLGKEPLQNKQQ